MAGLSISYCFTVCLDTEQIMDLVLFLADARIRAITSPSLDYTHWFLFVDAIRWKLHNPRTQTLVRVLISLIFYQVECQIIPMYIFLFFQLSTECEIPQQSELLWVSELALISHWSQKYPCWGEHQKQHIFHPATKFLQARLSDWITGSFLIYEHSMYLYLLKIF